MSSVNIVTFALRRTVWPQAHNTFCTDNDMTTDRRNTVGYACKRERITNLVRLANTRKPSYRWQTRAIRKPAKIAPIRRAYNVVADNTGLSSCV